MIKAVKIWVSGIVQGVGFRPFIYRLAKGLGLHGFVRNLGGSEVLIHIQGDPKKIREFIERLEKEKPPTAKIEEKVIEETEPLEINDFKILRSEKGAKLYSMIPPDFSICNDCIREVLDPSSRFYRYPFHSCAWCGPRFSMIYRLPYDRENTAMRDFPLCDICESEYEDPQNLRRFHAQGISCPKCGPRIWLADKYGEEIPVDDPIKEAAKLIDEGYIVAVKGVGGFHIAALATDDEVVLKIRTRKKRPEKPFALMALDTQVASRIVCINDEAKRVLESVERPIVLLPEREDSPVSKYVAPGLDKQGIMLPYTALHLLLLMETRDKFLIMTSGNEHGKPMCTDEESAFNRLKGIVDFFLLHNRRIVNRVDDSVVRFTDGELTLIRRSRGFAPAWIKIPFNLPRKIIAFGAELQNTGAVGFNNKVVVTQFIGDTDEYENLQYLERALSFFSQVYEIDPREAILVADMHPLYSSRKLAERWASKFSSELLLVQHHHAHIASVMAEKGVKAGEKVVGIAIDGVGYGIDKNIWGGEVLLCDYAEFERIGHLEYHPLPGGDLAVIYPVRTLIGILTKFMNEEEILAFLREKQLLKGLRRGELEAIVAIKQAKNAVKTSSMGRILDAFSALLHICYKRTYEGEPAIKLEAAARNGRLVDDLKVSLSWRNNVMIVNTTELMQSVIDHLNDASLNDLAFSIQYLLGRALGEIAIKNVKRSDFNAIFVSGGAAVNTYIIGGIKSIAKKEDVKVLLPNKLPAGDGGISLGQTVIVGARLLENV
ncbi:MAG: carbamoyltransferase HypF [Candidatus Njordarchaeales archaeon]